MFSKSEGIGDGALLALVLVSSIAGFAVGCAGVHAVASHELLQDYNGRVSVAWFVCGVITTAAALAIGFGMLLVFGGQIAESVRVRRYLKQCRQLRPVGRRPYA